MLNMGSELAFSIIETDCQCSSDDNDLQQDSSISFHLTCKSHLNKWYNATTEWFSVIIDNSKQNETDKAATLSGCYNTVRTQNS
jgi:hypothetical protein